MSSPSAPGQQYFPGQNEDRRSPDRLQPRLHLNADERRVLQECNRESFWYRCVPLSCLFVGTVQILASKGMIAKHPKYGTLFKNLGAGLAGYILGKVSYQRACHEKILRLDNSPLADSMRWGKSGLGLFTESVPLDRPQGESEQVETYRQNVDRRQGEIDIDSNVQHKGLDYETRDMVGFSESHQSGGGATAQASKPSLSYDDLRRKNRSTYGEHNTFPSPDSGRSGPYRQPPLPAAPYGGVDGEMVQGSGGESRPKYSGAPSSSSQRRPRRNKYGDIIEE